MQIDITGHHVDLTPALRTYVHNKFERLERHSDHVTGLHVVLTVEKLRHKADATIEVNGATLFANSIEQDMYAAIDCLTDKLDRQIKKHKEKLTSHNDRETVRTQATP